MTSFDFLTNKELAKTFSPFLNGDKTIRPALSPIPETKRQKFERKYGMLYTGASIAAGGTILYALHKGGKLFNMTEFFKKYYMKYKVKTFRKLNEYSLFKSIRYATSTSISHIGQKIIEFGNFLGNFNPVKDITFDRFCKKVKLKPMFDKLTELFTKSAKKLTLSKYQKSGKDLLAFQNCLNEIAQQVRNSTFAGGNIKGNQLAAELTRLSEQLSQEMQNIVGQNFSTRFDKTVSLLNSTSERKFLDSFKRNSGVSLFRQIIDKVKECGDFLPRKIMEPDKQNLYQGLMTSKKTISNSILDLYQTLSKSVDDVFFETSLGNKKLSKSYLKIRDLLSEFKSPATYEAKRAITRNNLIKALEEANLEFSKIPKSESKQQILNSLITTIREDKRGLTEEIVHLCKVLKESNPDLYDKLLKARNRFQQSFNEAVNFETEKAYGKLLDFSLHSLPTDLLTIFVGISGVGYALRNTKQSKREKTKNIIEKGIPVLGGITVSFLCNMRMVASGAGALCLGLISGIALNRIAKTFNHFYLKNDKQNNKKIA